jgi:hypothetical protein
MLRARKKEQRENKKESDKDRETKRQEIHERQRDG